MAQRLARRYFFYHSVFFTSKAFNRMTSSVKAVPARLTINSFSQRIYFSLIPPFFLLYFVIKIPLWNHDSCKKGERKFTPSIAAALLIRWTVLWFISYLLAVIAVIDMHILHSPSLGLIRRKVTLKPMHTGSGLSRPPTERLTDHFFCKHLLRSAWIIKGSTEKTVPLDTNK